MKFSTAGSVVRPVCDEYRSENTAKKVPATLVHDLDGKIEQFRCRQDAPGVIFLADVAKHRAAFQSTIRAAVFGKRSVIESRAKEDTAHA